MTTDDELCRYEVRDGVALVTFNRPERNNGMTGALELAYFARLAQANEDREARAIVVTGAGRAFCPGADLGGTSGPGDEPLPNTKVPTTFPLTVDKPLVAAVNGGGAGVGLVQALQCDVRFAASQARFTTAFARRGLIAEYGIAWLLPRIVGYAAASDLLVSGRTFDAAEALRIGLVNSLHDREEVVEVAMAYARDAADNTSPSSMATIKRQLRRYQTMTLDEAVADSDQLMRLSTKGADFEEGVGSFLEGRPPAFPPLGEGTRFPWMDEA
ncbi:MAG: enoyl-CoA hydratase [Acidimicrobiia bacterium]|nr:enoyl-CoA hydratase [Acidimicrobiia bacterium]